MALLGADGALNLSLPFRWNRKAFAKELSDNAKALPMGTSVMDELRHGARY